MKKSILWLWTVKRNVWTKSNMYGSRNFKCCEVSYDTLKLQKKWKE